MEGLQELITRMALHGMNIATPQIVLTVMANIDVSSREKYGHEF